MMEQQIRFCTAPDGVQIAYALSGEGPPLVRVLNWMTHLEYERDSPVWRHWTGELARENTYVRYDGRGCGLSDWEADEFSLAAWVQDLETVVNALGVERVPLLGLCRGAAIAVAFAVKHPERVSRLILYGGYARGRFKRGGPEQAEKARMLLQLVEHGWGQDNPAFRQVYTTLFLPEGTAEQVQWFNDLQRISTAPAIAAEMQAAAYALDVSELASKVRVPTLVLHAQGDAVIPFAEGRLLATLIPGARFVPLDSRNHILLEHEPAWQEFLSQIRKFLVASDAAPALAPHQALGALSARERALLDLIAQGLDNGQIAERLAISPKTVRNHITSIFSKLAVQTRAQAIVLARNAGLGQLPNTPA